MENIYPVNACKYSDNRNSKNIMRKKIRDSRGRGVKDSSGGINYFKICFYWNPRTLESLTPVF